MVRIQSGFSENILTAMKHTTSQELLCDVHCVFVSTLEPEGNNVWDTSCPKCIITERKPYFEHGNREKIYEFDKPPHSKNIRSNKTAFSNAKGQNILHFKVTL